MVDADILGAHDSKPCASRAPAPVWPWPEPRTPAPAEPTLDITRTFSEPSLAFAGQDYLTVFTAIDTQIATGREVARTIYITRPFAPGDGK